uniref:Uncharacterized protein n=1 Tax=Anopheles merus TaxID=30066 RepID=A0A182ULQ8_ANOME
MLTRAFMKIKYICMKVKIICSSGLTPRSIWWHGEVNGISKNDPNSSPVGFGITFFSSISLLAALFFSAVSLDPPPPTGAGAPAPSPCPRDTGRVAMLSLLSTSTVATFISPPPTMLLCFLYFFFFTPKRSVRIYTSITLIGIAGGTKLLAPVTGADTGERCETSLSQMTKRARLVALCYHLLGIFRLAALYDLAQMRTQMDAVVIRVANGARDRTITLPQRVMPSGAHLVIFRSIARH